MGDIEESRSKLREMRSLLRFRFYVEYVAEIHLSGKFYWQLALHMIDELCDGPVNFVCPFTQQNSVPIEIEKGIPFIHRSQTLKYLSRSFRVYHRIVLRLDN